MVPNFPWRNGASHMFILVTDLKQWSGTKVGQKSPQVASVVLTKGEAAIILTVYK